MKKHAILSPSASARWIACPPSARLEASMPDDATDFAEQGTCAHALCELKLKKLLGADTDAAQQEFDALRERWYDPEMERCAEDYAAEVWGRYQTALKACPQATLLIEWELDLTPFMPAAFGTADAVIVSDDTLEVIDFKYGRGVEVSAEENPQMRIYALGATADYDVEYDLKRVRMTIVQPRLFNVSSYEEPVETLKAWAQDTLKPAAQTAFKGLGSQTPGPHCRFCRVRATCGALAANALALFIRHPDKALITPEEYPELYAAIPSIKLWCTAVEDQALALALSGTDFPGFKLVEARTQRKIVDPEGLAASLSQEVPEDDLYRPRELKTITELERVVGKKTFAERSHGLVVKPEGKPTLVPLSDRRPAITINPINDFKDFQK